MNPTSRFRTLTTPAVAMALLGPPALTAPQITDVGTALKKPAATYTNNQVFGSSLAADGDDLAVGSRNGQTGSGEIELFQWTSTGWQPTQSLHSEAQPFSGQLTGGLDSFGTASESMDLEGDVLVVGGPGLLDGASGATPRGGIAIFRRVAGTWTASQLILPPVLTIPNSANGFVQAFGQSVDVAGDLMVVGAPGSDYPGTNDNSEGAVFLYERVAGQWVPAQTPFLYHPNLNPPVYDSVGRQFGVDVALIGDRLFVGAPRDRMNGVPPTEGSVVSFDLSAPDPQSTAALVYAPVPTDGARFGRSLAFDGERLVIGEPGAGGGQIYAADWDGSKLGALTAVGQPLAPGSGLGLAVDVMGNMLAAGAPVKAGEAMESRMTSSGEVPIDLLREYLPTGTDGYGFSIAISERGVFVGAPLSNVRPFQFAGAGLVWFFDRTCGVEPYCPATANSTGAAAELVALSTPSLLEDDFELRVSQAPAQEFGVLRFSSGKDSVPFGSGTSCLASPAGFAAPVARISTGGSLDLDVDMAALGFTSGSTWYFQFVFRDGKGGGGNIAANLTNALEVQFCL